MKISGKTLSPSEPRCRRDRVVTRGGPAGKPDCGHTRPPSLRCTGPLTLAARHAEYAENRPALPAIQRWMTWSTRRLKIAGHTLTKLLVATDPVMVTDFFFRSGPSGSRGACRRGAPSASRRPSVCRSRSRPGIPARKLEELVHLLGFPEPEITTGIAACGSDQKPRRVEPKARDQSQDVFLGP